MCYVILLLGVKTVQKQVTDVIGVLIVGYVLMM